MSLQTTVRRFWTYSNRFTEANAAGGNNTIRITPAAGTLAELLRGAVTMCDAAAGRAISIQILDEDELPQYRLLTIASPDNQTVTVPSQGANAGVDNNGMGSGGPIPPDGTMLRVYAASLAQNEYMDVKICCELLGLATAPTVTHTSSGTASTGTPTQNEVTSVMVLR